MKQLTAEQTDLLRRVRADSCETDATVRGLSEPNAAPHTFSYVRVRYKHGLYALRSSIPGYRVFASSPTYLLTHLLTTAAAATITG